MRKWLCRISMPISILAVFVYLIVRYTEVRVLEETTRSLPIPVLILLIVFSIIVGVGGSLLALFMWLDKIKKDPVSFYLFAPIILLMISVAFITKMILNKAEALIILNVEQMLKDISNYNESLLIVMCILGVGLIIGGIGMLNEKASA